MNAKTLISQILAQKSRIRQVYWVACGGSMIDLYPAHCLLLAESGTMESGIYTSREFLVSTPKKLGAASLVVVCSHSGNTPESVEAAVLAHKKGGAVITLTDGKGSACDDERFHAWVYPWGEDVPIAQVPSGISLCLAAELIEQQEGGFDKYAALYDALGRIDALLVKAREKVNRELCAAFADACAQNRFFYILGSGPNFSQTYGFAICSLMEMQWQNCCYIHSAEYFHGPFEATENGVFYFLQMGSGASRVMDERALAFLRTHTDRLMVLDALDYGMTAIDGAVRDYFDPILFYAMNVELRAARGRKFDHDPSVRRYMGIEKY